MPLAGVRAKRPGISDLRVRGRRTASETTIDQAQNEMTATGMRPHTVADIIAMMRLPVPIRANGSGVG